MIGVVDRNKGGWRRQSAPPPSTGQRSSGSNANNVQGDQQIINLYNDVNENLSMSYDTFTGVIERKIHEKLAEQASEFDLALADRDDLIQELSSERDHYMNAAAIADDRVAALRARSWLLPSWKPLGIAVTASLLLGAALGWSLTNREDGRTETADAADALIEPEPSQNVERQDVSVELVARTCGTSQYIVQLEEIAEGDSLDGARALVLRDELLNRINNAGLDIAVSASRGADYCIPNKPQLSESIFLWAGPFASKQDAEAVCQVMRQKAVSDDCYAASSR